MSFASRPPDREDRATTTDWTQGGAQANKKVENGETPDGTGNPPGAPGGAALGEADNN